MRSQMGTALGEKEEGGKGVRKESADLARRKGGRGQVISLAEA